MNEETTHYLQHFVSRMSDYAWEKWMCMYD